MSVMVQKFQEYEKAQEKIKMHYFHGSSTLAENSTAEVENEKSQVKWERILKGVNECYEEKQFC